MKKNRDTSTATVIRTEKQPGAGREELRMNQEMTFASGVSRGKKLLASPQELL